MKLIVRDIQDIISRVIGVCADDDRVYDYINQACRRLLNKGLWAGCYGRFTIYTADGCITWPRSIETIEAVADCCGTGIVRNQWFEFQETGYGLINGQNCCIGNQLIDRGSVVTYREMTGGTNSFVRAYMGSVDDTGKKITIQGYDNYGQWVRSQNIAGEWIDGEEMALAFPYAQTGIAFTSVTGVIRDATVSRSLLYEWDMTNSVEYDLASYDPDETLPQYRRSQLSGMCSNDDDKPVTVMAKMRHINASTPNDYIIPPCPDAIKLMVQAIRKEENDLMQEAVVYEAKAVQTLQEQTMHHLGDAVHTIRMVGAGQYGGGIPQFF